MMIFMRRIMRINTLQMCRKKLAGTPKTLH
uniref:Uncharacterized protein n=1 Tax=Siphoviridae sp. ctLgc23 TaxID=2825455 RepID=A0A8S5QH98_9CAUD|nr:MAG TPA: hypothetical protein [Siphoviridae sp. ctLgc23]